MNEQTDWASVRARFCERFGASPAWDDGEDAAVTFAKHPGAVIALLEELGQAYDAGRVHSPWRIFAKRLPRLERDHRSVDISRDAHIRLAELWIRNAGLLLDREEEVVAWLFDDTGQLHAWQDDEVLRERMLALWRTERPRAERLEGMRRRPHSVSTPSDLQGVST